MQYAQIGDVIFELLAYRAHTEEQEFPFARLETIQPPSSLQYMGDRDLKKVILSVRWHMQWCDPQKEYETLLEYAEDGEANPLIIGEQVVGDFVVKKVRADFQQIDINGNAVIIDAEIELEEFVEKKLETKKIQQKKKKQATAKKKSPAPNQPQMRAVTKTNPDGYKYPEIERVK